MIENIKSFNETISASTVKALDNVIIYNYHNIDESTVKIIGTNKFNCIIIAPNVTLKNSIIDFRSENSIVYVKSSGIRANFMLGFGSCVYIDELTTFTNTANILGAEGNDIYIGKDCMFAEHVNITNSDGHPIYDYNGKRLNEGGDIIIGNHVWIGRNSDILKNVIIQSGSIVGSRSVVTKSIPYASIAAGAPAQIKKENIVFSKETTVRQATTSYNEERSYHPERLAGNEKEFLSFIKRSICKKNS